MWTIAGMAFSLHPSSAVISRATFTSFASGSADGDADASGAEDSPPACGCAENRPIPAATAAAIAIIITTAIAAVCGLCVFIHCTNFCIVFAS